MNSLKMFLCTYIGRDMTEAIINVYEQITTQYEYTICEFKLDPPYLCSYDTYVDLHITLDLSTVDIDAENGMLLATD